MWRAQAAERSGGRRAARSSHGAAQHWRGAALPCVASATFCYLASSMLLHGCRGSGEVVTMIVSRSRQPGSASCMRARVTVGRPASRLACRKGTIRSAGSFGARAEQEVFRGAYIRVNPAEKFFYT